MELLCPRCEKSVVDWEEGTDTESGDLLDIGVLVCLSTSCEGRWVGMRAFTDEQQDNRGVSIVIKREYYMLVQLLQAAARCADATFAAAHGDVLLDAAGEREYGERQQSIVCYEACKRLSYYQVENLHVFTGWMLESISRREDKDYEGNVPKPDPEKTVVELVKVLKDILPQFQDDYFDDMIRTAIKKAEGKV